MDLNYDDYDNYTPENPSARLPYNKPPSFDRPNYKAVREPDEFVVALEMNYYEERDHGYAIVGNEHIEMDMYGHGTSDKSTPLAVIEALEAKLRSYYNKLFFEGPKCCVPLFSRFMYIPRFILFGVGTYNFYFLDQGIHYLAHLYLKDKDSYDRAERILDIHNLLVQSSKFLEDMVPWCGRDRFKTYGKIFEERVKIAKSIGYKKQEFYFFHRSNESVLYPPM